MENNATSTDLNNLEKRIDKRFDDLMETLSRFANDIEKKLNDHDDEFRKLNKKYDHLIDTIDGFIGRIDKYEVELASRDHKIDRLERWIEEIAKKTGVQMPY